MAAELVFGAARLPTVPEEIAPWLAEHFDCDLASVEHTRAIYATASKLFYTIHLSESSSTDQPRPYHVCVKGGFDPKVVAAYPWLSLIYRREVEFFNRIAPSLKHLELPKVWWAGHDSKTQGILIMDDLNALGCTYGSPTEAWSVEMVYTGIEQLAALHAGTWGVKTEDFPWVVSDYDQLIMSLMETFDEVVNSADRPSIPAYLKDQQRMTAILAKHFRTRNPNFHCFVHGDPHLGNTYLTAQGAPRFLDWQIIHIGSAFHDVAYFVGGALAVEDRRLHERAILDHYLDALRKLGGPSFSAEELEEVWLEYRKSFLAGFGWVVCPYVMQSRESVHAMAVRYATAMDDHKVVELVESLPDA